jgi:hypothetical protein
MEPHGPKFGGGANETILHPLVLVVMLLAILLYFVLPRKYVLIPVIFTTFLIPMGQQFLVGGVHLFVARILILAAFIRAMMAKVPGQKSKLAGGWNSIDTAFTWYVVVSAVTGLMQYPDVGMLVNQIGYLWDFLLGYLLLRALIQDKNDTFLTIKCFAMVMVILAVGMMIEQSNMVNIFGLLGGVNAIPEVREGKIRSQAAFQHALTAGTFAATALPLFFLLWKNAKAKAFAAIGLAAATIMTFTTQTSTSLITFGAAIVGVLFWPARKKMKFVRSGLLGMLIALHMVMKAPVWFLIARVDLTGSSSSYQRAELIDQFVNHFSSWWLMGTKDAATWGWDMWDAQNMYVSVGEAGGLAALIFFILVISRSFARIGDARKQAGTRKEEWLFWFLGAAVFANVVAFFGVNYFDQSRMAWFSLISMICACTIQSTSPSTEAPRIALKVISHPCVEDAIDTVRSGDGGSSMSRHLFD